MASESYNVTGVNPAMSPHGQRAGAIDQRNASQGQSIQGKPAEGQVAGTRATRDPSSVGVAGATETATDGKAQAGTIEQVAEAVDRINEMMQNGKQTLTFQLDDESDRMVIRVMDAQTKEVVRQIPSEEALEFAKYVDGLVGLIFNKKA